MMVSRNRRADLLRDERPTLFSLPDESPTSTSFGYMAGKTMGISRRIYLMISWGAGIFSSTCTRIFYPYIFPNMTKQRTKFASLIQFSDHPDLPSTTK